MRERDYSRSWKLLDRRLQSVRIGVDLEERHTGGDDAFEIRMRTAPALHETRVGL